MADNKPQDNQNAKPQANLIEVEIKRDFWDEQGERQRAGTTIKVPVEVALEGIESGALARVKKD